MSAKLLNQRKQIGFEFSIHQLAGSRCGGWSVGLVDAHHPTRAGLPACANVWWPDERFGRNRRWRSALAEWHVFFGECNQFHDTWLTRAAYPLTGRPAARECDGINRQHNLQTKSKQSENARSFERLEERVAPDLFGSIGITVGVVLGAGCRGSTSATANSGSSCITARGIPTAVPATVTGTVTGGGAERPRLLKARLHGPRE
jgi:hypothetical protein